MAGLQAVNRLQRQEVLMTGDVTQQRCAGLLGVGCKRAGVEGQPVAVSGLRVETRFARGSLQAVGQLQQVLVQPFEITHQRWTGAGERVELIEGLDDDHALAPGLRLRVTVEPQHLAGG